MPDVVRILTTTLSNRPLPRVHFYRAGQQQQPPAQEPPANADATIEKSQKCLDKYKKAHDHQRHNGDGTMATQFEAYEKAGGNLARPEFLKFDYTGASKDDSVLKARLNDGVSPDKALVGCSDEYAAKRREGRLPTRTRPIAAFNAHWGSSSRPGNAAQAPSQQQQPQQQQQQQQG